MDRMAVTVSRHPRGRYTGASDDDVRARVIPMVHRRGEAFCLPPSRPIDKAYHAALISLNHFGNWHALSG